MTIHNLAETILATLLVHKTIMTPLTISLISVLPFGCYYFNKIHSKSVKSKITVK